MELKICHLYPDVMNQSGDRGNVICMEKRLVWRGLDAVVTGITVGEALRAADFDLFFLGDGQPFEQELLLADAMEKKQELLSAVNDGVPMLAVCGGYQLLGSSFKTEDGRTVQGLGVLDAVTEWESTRLVGNYAFTCTEPKTTVVGFENHSGKTYLGAGVTPLGMTEPGHGNNGKDGTEGARYLNLIATYAHGCVLPKNPVLCDAILKLALERKYGAAELPPLDDTVELAAHSYMESRLAK